MQSNHATLTASYLLATAPPTTSGSFVSSIWQTSNPQAAGVGLAQTVVIKCSGIGTACHLKVCLVPDPGDNLSLQTVYSVSSGSGVTEISTDGYYVAQLDPGVVYVVCTALGSSTPTVTLSTGPSDEGFDVTVFGATGAGITDDSSAIQLAINAGSFLRTISPLGTAAEIGCAVYFPPGTYSVASTLVLPTYTSGTTSNYYNVNVSLLGYPSGPLKGQTIAPRSVLLYTGTSSLFQGNPVIGFQMRNLGLSLTTALTDNHSLIDIRGSFVGSTHSDSVGILIEDCSFVPHPTDLVATGSYINLACCLSVVISRCNFYGLDYAITGYSGVEGFGYSNGVTICNQTRFQNQNIVPIYNPGQAWTLDTCMVENNHAGLSSFVDMGMDYTNTYRCKALTISGCWMGDPSSSGGSWVKFAGKGLMMSGNHIECNGSSALKIIGDSNGISVLSNEIFTQFSSSSCAIDFDSGTVKELTFLGNALTSGTYSVVPFVGTLPTSFLSTVSTSGGDRLSCDGLDSSGELTATALTVSGSVSSNGLTSTSLIAAPTATIGGGTLAGDQILGLNNGSLRIHNGNVYFLPVANPSTALTATQSTTGLVAPGTYLYKVSFVTNAGETALGATSTPLTVTTLSQVSLTAIPLGNAADAVIARKIYRTAAASNVHYYLLQTISDNTTTTFTDNVPDATLITNVEGTYRDNTTSGRFFLNGVNAGGFVGYNTWFGMYNLGSITSGYSNTAVGFHAGSSLTTGSNNSFFGTSAGANLSTGGSNTLIGFNAGQSLTTGSLNMLLGGNAGANLDVGGYNTCMGYKAGFNLDGGSNYNVFIGSYSQPYSSATLSYAGGIGYSAIVNASNTLALGGTGSAYMAVVINGTTANAMLQVNAINQTTVGAIVQGAASALTDLQRWQVSTSVVASINQYGDLGCNGLALGSQGIASGSTFNANPIGGVFIESTYSTTGPQTVNLPATPTPGQVLIVIDEAGNAATNNITVSGNGHNINGAATALIGTNYGSLRLRWSSSRSTWYLF